jgi:hypothetical protein
MKKFGIPNYALIISLWIPLGLVLLTLILLIVPLPGLQNIAISMAAIFLGLTGPILFLFVNGLVAIAGGKVAKSKERAFAPFYFFGLVLPLLPALVALMLKPKKL